MRFSYALAALAATTAFAAPAAAQTAPSPPDAEIDARALILQPASITAGSALDFGVVLASTTAGSVTVNPDPAGALVSAAGGATAVSGAQRGTFRGNSQPGTQVTVAVTYDGQLTHTNGGNAFLAFTGASSGAGTFNVRPDGLFTVYVGGTIAVAANQAPGQYEGKVYVDAQFQ